MSGPNSSLPGWHPLGEVDPRALSDDRLQLHWAAQLLAAVGQTHLPPRADDSHRAMSWDPSGDVFVTGVLPGPRRLSVALHPASLEIRVRDAGEIVAADGLAGRTLDEAHRWLEEALAQADGGEVASLGRPEYDMPSHAVGEGAPLDPSSAGLVELGRWYRNAHLAVVAQQGAEPRAGEIRVWPHHFDLAVLVTVTEAGDPEALRSVGIGLSPGDGSYAEPYLYVNSWPPATAEALPSLAGPGHWHTEGWIGAVLTGTEVVARGGGEDQAAGTMSFLGEAVGAALSLVGV